MTWATDWVEAARNPWKTRLLMFCGFAVLGAVSASTSSDSIFTWSVGIVAAGFGMVGLICGELIMRRVAGGAAFQRTAQARGLSLIGIACALVIGMAVAVAVSAVAGALVLAAGLVGVLVLRFR